MRRKKLTYAPFIAWDGEGYTDETGQHHYQLFGNSCGDRISATSLGWKECFELLLSAPKVANHVIYGGDYDVIMMTRDMPFPVKDRLLRGLPVRYEGYRMEWFRRKYLRLSHKASNRSMILYDVISFFQTSFVNACRSYLGDSEALDEMFEMKRRRDAFVLGDESIIPYWQSELDHLVQLMDKLRELLYEVEIFPGGWYGPGAIASAILKRERMEEAIRFNIPDETTDAAERAYYGGRFEQFKVGYVPNVVEYDIRSAYPDAIAQLPNFARARWERTISSNLDGNRIGSIESYGLYRISWNITANRNMEIGPLPWRDDKGRVFYPLTGYNSWYWGIEVANLKTYDIPFVIHEAHVPRWNWNNPECDERPFAWIADMYYDRAKMKAEGKPAEKALKLGMNSIYGKLAQSTGSKLEPDGTWKKPKWHNILYAGWVTAATRAKIYRTAYSNRFSLVAIETDAIFCRKDISEIQIGKRLGEWEESHFPECLYVNSGVYYALDSTGVWKYKSRGVEKDSGHNHEYWREIFQQLPARQLEVSVTARRFGTVLRSKNYGNWYDHTLTYRLPTRDSKRVHNPYLCIVCRSSFQTNEPIPSFATAFHPLHVPEEPIGTDVLSSIPYPFPWRDDKAFQWPESLDLIIPEDSPQLLWSEIE